jgi:hypothetical protein
MTLMPCFCQFFNLPKKLVFRGIVTEMMDLDDEEEDWLVHLLLAQIGSLQIEEPSKF